MSRLSFLIALVVLVTGFEVCGAQPADKGRAQVQKVSPQKIEAALRTLDEYYGDVKVSIDCRRDKYPAAKIICRDKYLYNLATLNSRACVLSIENATGSRLDDHKYYHLNYVDPSQCLSSKRREECIPSCVTRVKLTMRYGRLPPATCVTWNCLYEFFKREINDSGGDVSPFSDSGQDVAKPTP
jgi:hypothetical protein